MTDKYDDLRKALARRVTPGPWSWWTSNSHNRLSSDSTMKDGDVLSAVKASDGMPVVNCNDDDRELIVHACNVAAELLAERDALLEDKRRLDALAEMKADLIFLVDGYFVEDEGDGEYKWSADIRTAIDNSMIAK